MSLCPHILSYFAFNLRERITSPPHWRLNQCLGASFGRKPAGRRLILGKAHVCCGPAGAGNKEKKGPTNYITVGDPEGAAICKFLAAKDSR